MSNVTIRSDWTTEEIKGIYYRPLLRLIMEACEIHCRHHKAGEVQVCSLLSVKTGGCTENCSYCAQSASHQTHIEPHRLLDVREVMKAAVDAKGMGISRFCMGAAWREVRDNGHFKRILEMISEVKQLDLEVCCSLGMLTKSQAQQLKEAGLTAYNHNIDTSENFYPRIVTSRSYKERLDTLAHVMEAGIAVCSGGIIGMGESDEDRIEMIKTLANLPVHPESVPVNLLIPIQGTPLEEATPPTVWEALRIIATLRCVLPDSRIRLSAGRETLNEEQQALCFIAGANSLFTGEKLLTAPNAPPGKDQYLFSLLGIQPG